MTSLDGEPTTSWQFLNELVKFSDSTEREKECHLCKFLKKENDLYTCPDEKCENVFCEPCLNANIKKHINQKAKKNKKRKSDYRCPHCGKKCNCDKSLRKKKKDVYMEVQSSTQNTIVIEKCPDQVDYGTQKEIPNFAEPDKRVEKEATPTNLNHEGGRHSTREKKRTTHFQFSKCHACQREECTENLLKCKNQLCGEQFCLKCLKQNIPGFEGKLHLEKLRKEEWSCLVCRELCKCKRCSSLLLDDIKKIRKNIYGDDLNEALRISSTNYYTLPGKIKLPKESSEGESQKASSRSPLALVTNPKNSVEATNSEKIEVVPSSERSPIGNSQKGEDIQMEENVEDEAERSHELSKSQSTKEYILIDGYVIIEEEDESESVHNLSSGLGKRKVRPRRLLSSRKKSQKKLKKVASEKNVNPFIDDDDDILQINPIEEVRINTPQKRNLILNKEPNSSPMVTKQNIQIQAKLQDVKKKPQSIIPPHRNIPPQNINNPLRQNNQQRFKPGPQLVSSGNIQPQAQFGGIGIHPPQRLPQVNQPYLPPKIFLNAPDSNLPILNYMTPINQIYDSPSFFCTQFNIEPQFQFLPVQQMSLQSYPPHLHPNMQFNTGGFPSLINIGRMSPQDAISQINLLNPPLPQRPPHQGQSEINHDKNTGAANKNATHLFNSRSQSMNPNPAFHQTLKSFHNSNQHPSSSSQKSHPMNSTPINNSSVSQAIHQQPINLDPPTTKIIPGIGEAKKNPFYPGGIELGKGTGTNVAHMQQQIQAHSTKNPELLKRAAKEEKNSPVEVIEIDSENSSKKVDTIPNDYNLPSTKDLVKEENKLQSNIANGNRSPFIQDQIFLEKTSALNDFVNKQADNNSHQILDSKNKEVFPNSKMTPQENLNLSVENIIELEKKNHFPEKNNSNQ